MLVWLGGPNALGPPNHSSNLLERPALLLVSGWAFQHGMQIRTFVLMYISTSLKGCEICVCKIQSTVPAGVL